MAFLNNWPGAVVVLVSSMQIPAPCASAAHCRSNRGVIYKESVSGRYIDCINTGR